MRTDSVTQSVQSAQPVRRDTRQRRAVRRALSRSESFVSAQELHAELRDAGERIGLATVYRALADLAAAAEADVLQTEEGETLYRACTPGEHHHHVVCRECGLAVEVQADAVERWVASVAAEHGFTQTEHTVNVFGVCADCAAEGR